MVTNEVTSTIMQDEADQHNKVTWYNEKLTGG